MELHLAAMAIGGLLDLCFGDPHGFPHPVRVIGSLIAGLERLLRKLFPATKRGELAGGTCLVLLTLLLTAGVSAAFLRLSGLLGPWFGTAFEGILIYYLLAARSLRDESMKVYHSLKRGDTAQAREDVSMIVGRDTACLNAEGIAKAAVETVAENASDGVIAPLFYLALGGPVLGWLYKAVNTMDSMVGYQNETYRFFGRAAAKLDDLLNLLPSRLSALLLVFSAFILRLDGRAAFRIWRRDRRNHKSPNSAQTEAACAGALGIRLAGDAWYFGKLVKKPFIGDESRPVEAEDIRRTNRLMVTAALLAFGLAAGVRAAVLKIMGL